ncbi:unnamed protein product [Sympodiomycopsis kandeliae]
MNAIRPTRILHQTAPKAGPSKPPGTVPPSSLPPTRPPRPGLRPPPPPPSSSSSSPQGNDPVKGGTNKSLWESFKALPKRTRQILGLSGIAIGFAGLAISDWLRERWRPQVDELRRQSNKILEDAGKLERREQPAMAAGTVQTNSPASDGFSSEQAQTQQPEQEYKPKLFGIRWVDRQS